MWTSIVGFFEKYVLQYNVMAAIGLLVAYGTAMLLCRRTKQDAVRLIPCLLCGVPGLLLGAKLFGILSLCCYRLQQGLPLDWSVVSTSGIVFYGGLIGYFLTLCVAIPRIMKKRRLAWDIVAVTTPLFHGFARIGCYFGRCCYGVVTEGDFCAAFFEHRLPVQLIESAFNFLLFGVLLVLLLKRVKPLHGKLTELYLLCYALFRFTIEFFRADEIRGAIGPFSFSQWVSIGILIFLALHTFLGKPPKPDAEDEPLQYLPETETEEPPEQEA